jgi:DNA replication and repair protein RecF
MWIRRLTLTNFRNYRQQAIEFPRGAVLVLGDNAQGKSNLLEALFLLATGRSERASNDGELIGWDALDDPQPVARVAAEVERADGALELEVIVAARERDAGQARVTASKRLRVNGVPRRQADLVGQLAAVLFTTEDMELVSGPPAGRRRFLDVMLSQVDPAYVRALQRYGKVITQRNALLRRIQDGDARPDELAFWDEELAKDGASIMCMRAEALGPLAAAGQSAHRDLSGGVEDFVLDYVPKLEGWNASRVVADADALPGALRGALDAGRRRDIGAGMTLTGPHRDDLSFMLDGTSAAAFASRGQQRTAALALRLAEARFIAQRKGDLPVVLLDDVLSELDEGRRAAVLDSLGDWDQIIITSADGDRFTEGVRPASIYRVVGGSIESVS